MSLKSIDYMIERAAAIAMADSDARVLVVFSSYHSAREAFDKLRAAKPPGAFHFNSMRFTALNGSTVTFMGLLAERISDIGGTMVTHGFSVDLDPECIQAVEQRIRSATYKGKYPMGLYTRWGARVILDY